MSWTSASGDNNDDKPRDPYAAPSGDQSPPQGAQPPGHEQPPGHDQPPAYAQPSGDVPTEPPAWSGPAQQQPYGQPPAEPPKSILTAVKLMYVGAGLAVLSLVLALVLRDDVREDTIDQLVDGGTSPADAESMADSLVAFSIVSAVIIIVLWLWMASANRKGKQWARVTATVLGGLNILFTLLSLFSGGGGLNLLVSVITLVLAGYILWLLYRPESTTYYQASSRKF